MAEPEFFRLCCVVQRWGDLKKLLAGRKEAYYNVDNEVRTDGKKSLPKRYRGLLWDWKVFTSRIISVFGIMR